MKKVIVYTLQKCNHSKNLKEWLKENGVDFEERDVSESKTHLEELVEYGVNKTPFSVIKSENNYIKVTGFDKETFEKELLK
ncbi:hypothetical protein AAV35_004420 [Salimicrobium jeotgali]|uniref:Glutaredoxin domain-containing protein n=1 Tax=Salimicrobium jeotgali TaxID=1230341 RepID=K2H624_9BACI|nr:glutaredoxin family protein [Salimicrobium jeotgali]AKG04102.1 hypothetical protein AAV35_004420 [Salimicrobium jeotgali]EKE31230.1 hypothetical protein MJ3_09678 [Salimicrobium jeotgali]MBM7697207.1 arsenate reductase-like glutaredoxin family protein [Salimicrobium jeotgali]